MISLRSEKLFIEATLFQIDVSPLSPQSKQQMMAWLYRQFEFDFEKKNIETPVLDAVIGVRDQFRKHMKRDLTHARLFHSGTKHEHGIRFSHTGPRRESQSRVEIPSNLLPAELTEQAVIRIIQGKGRGIIRLASELIIRT